VSIAHSPAEKRFDCVALCKPLPTGLVGRVVAKHEGKMLSNLQFIEK